MLQLKPNKVSNYFFFFSSLLIFFFFISVAQYLRDKAEATESPLLKEQLNEIADNLDRLADEVIEHANRLLENPEDPSNQAAMENAIQELKKEMERANEALKGNFFFLSLTRKNFYPYTPIF